MGGVINVSYPKLHALSIDSNTEHIKTIHLKLVFIQIIVFTPKWLPWQPGVKSELALLRKMFYWGQRICLPTFMHVSQGERFQLILTLATGLPCQSGLGQLRTFCLCHSVLSCNILEHIQLLDFQAKPISSSFQLQRSVDETRLQRRRDELLAFS